MTFEFLFIAESGVLEQQAVLLCESIRKFGGRHAGNPVTILQPRKEKPVSIEGRARLQEMGAQVVELSVVSPCPEYGTSYRIFACADYEKRTSADVLIFMDSDTVLLAEPDLDLQGADVAARPVDVKGMCTEGGDANEAYWRRLCLVCGVDYERLPWVTTTVDRARVKASYNGGLTVVKTAAGLFGKTADFFLRSLRTELIPWPERTTGFPAGCGMVSVEGGRLWGSSQACLSLTITALGLSVRTLPPALNFPLNFYSELLPEIRNGSIPEILHLHYHHIFRNDPRENPFFCGLPGLPAGAAAWLWSRLVEGSVGAEEADSPSRVIMVLGMHRSGTSTVTKGLEALGVDLGSELMPSAADNPKGFWGDTGFYQLNEELLKILGRSWCDLERTESEELVRLGEGTLFFRALELVRSRMRGKSLVGIKDPRFAILLPFWKKVFLAAGVSVSHVVAIRNPLSVADSLVRRDSLSKSHAVWLWVMHYAQIVSNTSGVPLAVVDYDELITAPKLQMARVAGVLGLHVDGKAMQVFASEFLEPRLSHSRYSGAELAAEPICDSLVVEMYDTLLAQSRSSAAPDPEDWTKLGVKWGDSLKRFDGLWTFISKLASEKRALTALSTEQRIRHELQADTFAMEQRALETRAAEQIARVQNLEASVAAFAVHSDRLGQRLNRIEASLGWRFWKKITGIFRMIANKLGYRRRPSE